MKTYTLPVCLYYEILTYGQLYESPKFMECGINLCKCFCLSSVIIITPLLYLEKYGFMIRQKWNKERIKIHLSGFHGSFQDFSMD